MQGYKEIALTDIARDAVMQLQENIKTIATNNAGTSFPTTNLYDGLMCYRTDQKRQYVYNASSKEWEAVAVSNADQATKASQDGQGNTISTTYAKKASPTFTGTVTVPTLTVTTSLTIPGGKIYIE